MSTLESRQKVVYWGGIVKKFRESELSVGDYSKKYRVSSNKLSYWKTRIEKLENSERFVEVRESSTNVADNSVTLSINDVITINFSCPPSPKWISELISNVKKVA